MVEAVELRRALAAFLGDGGYRKFVAEGVRQGKLRYWQEQQWNRFTAAHPEFAVSAEELAVVLRGCERYGEEWQRSRRATTITAALVGCILAGAVHVALVIGCFLLYARLYPQDGEFLAYLPEMAYVSMALCAAPLSMIFGASIGVRGAQLREPVAGSETSRPPEPPASGNSSPVDAPPVESET